MKLIDKLKEGVWNVGVIKLDVLDILKGKPYKIEWMKHYYYDRFFADPFLLEKDNDNYYILAEEYKFYDRKGRIVLLTVRIKDVRLIKKELILDEEYHLSYPIPFDNCIHPECYRSGVLASYDINIKGIAKKKIELEYPLIDPTFFRYKGIDWLFGTSSKGRYNAQRDLFVFYKNGQKYIPIKDAPVKSDNRTARPGGLLFEREGILYRPAQNCEHFYGESIQIMKVEQLSKDSYKESVYKEIKDLDCGKDGIHTFNVYDGFVIVDGFKETILPLKILYIKFKKIYNLLFEENMGNAYKIVNSFYK